MFRFASHVRRRDPLRETRVALAAEVKLREAAHALSRCALETTDADAIAAEAVALAVDALGAESGAFVIEPQGEGELAVAVRGPDGMLGVLSVSGPPAGGFTDADGELLEALADVLALAIPRARADASARAREVALERALDGAGMGAWDVCVAEGTAMISRGLAEIMGGPEDPTGRSTTRLNVLGRLHPDDRDRVIGETDEWHERGGDAEFEYRLQQPDGSVRWYVARGRSVAEPGCPAHTVGIVHDITREHELRHELERDAALQRLMVENSTDLLALVALDGTPLYVSPSCERMLGYTVAELLEQGLDAYDRIDPLDLGAVAAGVLRAMAGEDSLPVTFRIESKSGTWIELEGIATAISGENGSPEMLLVAARDLTQHRLAQEEVDRLERQNELLLASVGEGVIATDEDGLITRANPAALAMLGYDSEDELRGRHIHHQLHHTRRDGSVYPAEECPLLGALTGRTVRGSNESFWRKDGSSFPVEYTGAPVRAGERTVGLVAVFEDIGDRQRLEADLRQAQKMEALGQLAGGIAHDFNNVLLALRAFGELALRRLERNEEGVAGDIEEIVVATDRATDLTRQLLAFSRRQLLHFEVLDLNDVVRETHRLLNPLFGADVEIEVTYATSPVFVKADIGQLEQVITNLALNGRDAMPAGGRLEVVVASAQLESDAPEELGLTGPCGVLTVSDTGEGMDADTLALAFEPFFTTKGAFGTGLGLPTVDGIVRQYGGRLQVDSEPGVGTAFTVYLPATDEAPVEHELSWRRTSSAGGTVLLVDDDPSVRGAVEAMLDAHGYDVVTAESGEAALRMFEANSASIDLVLTDIVMPGLDGRGLAERMRALRPEVRVLLMSGYTGREPVVTGEDPLTDYLQKPFTGEELDTSVRAMLDRELK